jgi:hypothetical protein
MSFVDHDAALRFLHTAYDPDDWVAVFLKSYVSGRIAQRVVPVSLAMSRPFQDWLARESRSGLNVFVGVNAVASRQTSRRRRAIGAIRHVFLDADRDGSAVLTAIAARPDLPSTSYVLHSSPNRVHVFWRAAGFTIDQVEALQRQLARELNTDPAATSCSQTTRLCGFRNQKYLPPPRVTVEYRSVDRVYTPNDFPLPLTVTREMRSPRTIRSISGTTHALERARRCVAAAPAAISGQHGDLLTFRICCRLVRGFALSDTDAMAVLAEWNTRCQPPWSERELRRKLQHALRYGREPIGGLLEAQP